MLEFPLKVATWNVNGLRARVSQLLEWLETERPDVLCLQEIRVSPDQIPMDLCELQGFSCCWHGGEKGYSGVGLHVSRRLGTPVFSHPAFDYENRIVAADLDRLSLLSVYVPNGGKDFPAKMRFLEALETHLAALVSAGRGVILCGDLNIARQDMDVHPKERKKMPVVGYLPEERQLLERILSHGFVDVQRALAPDDDQLFTWWAPWRNLRQRNIGWRIDYVLASHDLARRAVTCVSQREVGTSDHGPVVAVFG
ncbi:MAG: exodeoxyribonuclease III [Armatimonadetes bacterium]|nr:exodeoxyribonuclease III [Armatimonadota bacterium]